MLLLFTLVLLLNLPLSADEFEDMINQYNHKKNTPEVASDGKSQAPFSGKKSDDRGFGIYIDDSGASHWIFSFDSDSHNPSPWPHPSNHSDYDLNDVMHKYGIHNGKIVPLYAEKSRIGMALVTGDRHGLTECQAVQMRYEPGNIVINVPVDEHFKMLDDVQIFALQKSSVDSFPFYRKDREGGNAGDHEKK